MARSGSRWWPLIKLLPVQTSFRFMRFVKLYAALSTVATVAAVVLALVPFRPPCAGLNCGVDFRGGTEMQLTTPGPADLGRIRSTLSGLNLGDVQVQTFGAPNQVRVILETPEGQDTSATVAQARAALSRDVDGVRFGATAGLSSKVSGELLRNGVLALVIGIVLMMVYIWFRFGLTFGVGAAVALLHDVILTFGLFAVAPGMEFNLTSVAAILTIIGYSVNDTVVVLDRVRENLRKYKRMPLSELIDLSINETLSRTAITGITGIMALSVLAAFGGEALFGFSIAMIFGIVIGTYSSFFVAAPVLMLLGVKRGEEEAQPLKPAPAR